MDELETKAKAMYEAIVKRQGLTPSWMDESQSIRDGWLKSAREMTEISNSINYDDE